MNDNRKAFIDALCDLAQKDDKIVFITCDVGFKYVEEFQHQFPDRFFNLGVTEQSTIMIAVGMAKAGLKPYVYSMIPFVLFRPFEMVRNGVVKHNANVKLIGVKGSEAYKFLGFSHNMTSPDEDTKLCDILGLDWITPKNEEEATSCINETYAWNKAAYIRL